MRNPACVSTLDDLTTGTFSEIYDDSDANPDLIKKVIFCSGKIYFDLANEKIKRNISDTAIVRMEQIYPLPQDGLNSIYSKYTQASKWLWVQEEPENMGPWPFIQRKIKDRNFTVVARSESGSPAGGLSINHNKRQQIILDSAFE